MPDPGCLAGLEVLIVEDELLVALAYESLLVEHGCTPLGPAPSVEHALDLIAASPPDAVLLDGNLRGRLSTPVAEKLESRNIPFLLVTGYETLTVADAVLSRAPRLVKPVNPRRLAEEMARVFC